MRGLGKGGGSSCAWPRGGGGACAAGAPLSAWAGSACGKRPSVGAWPYAALQGRGRGTKPRPLLGPQEGEGPANLGVRRGAGIPCRCCQVSGSLLSSLPGVAQSASAVPGATGVPLGMKPCLQPKCVMPNGWEVDEGGGGANSEQSVNSDNTPCSPSGRF